MRVTVADILRARGVLRRHLSPTPLYRHPLLSSRLGFDAYVKHENHAPTGSFKVRGGLNLLANLGTKELKRGLVSATRGNHGLSLAHAGRCHGARVVIYVPRANNPEKNLLLSAMGAEIVEFGRDFDEARLEAEARAATEGLRYVHPANEPLLVAGVGTLGLEIAEQLPDVDAVIVPMGAGTCAAGVMVALRALLPHARVIGVQAERAPALARSLKEGRIIHVETADTFAGGLATRCTFELPFTLLQGIDQVVLVSEKEMREAVREALETTHNVAEGAAAAAYAAARQLRKSLASQRVVIVHTGQNTDRNTLRWTLSALDA